MRDAFGRFAHFVSDAIGSPYAFCVAGALVVVWAVSGPFLHFSEVWQLTINTATTIVTFLMVFLIQNTQNRDARAVHRKLDELLKATEAASDRLVRLEQKPESEARQLEAEG